MPISFFNNIILIHMQAIACFKITNSFETDWTALKLQI